MRALLLAAGLGTRLRPLTETVPKCLVPIHGRPLLDYWFERLLGSGRIERILVNTSYLAQQVRAHVAASPWRTFVDLVHEEELLGTGGTVLANRDWFGAGPFLVAHADNLTTFDVAGVLEGHRRRPEGCAVTMMTFHTDSPRSCGIVELDPRGVVIGFHEKAANPPGNNANAAVYVFEPEVLEFLAGLGRRTIDLSTEVLPHFVGRIVAVANRGYHRDIGSLDSLAKAQQEFRPV